MRHKLLSALLLSSALTLPVGSTLAATAAATARVSARADEAAAAEKSEARKKPTTSKASAKSADKTAEKTGAEKTGKADPTSKGKKGSASAAESKKDTKTAEASSKKKAGAKTTTAEKGEAKSKTASKADSAKSSKSKTAEASSKKTDPKKTDKKVEDEKVTATASAKGTPYVIPDKGEKYGSRKSGNLTAQAKPKTTPVKTAAAKPETKPAEKPVVQARVDAPKPAPAPVPTTPVTTAAVASAPLTSDADKAVNDLFGASMKIDGTPAPSPVPVKAATMAQTEAPKPEAPKPAVPKVEEKLTLPAAPFPYQATVTPEAAPTPKADLNAALTPQKTEPKTVSEPTPTKAAEVVASTPLPVKPPVTTVAVPTLTVPETVRKPVETPAPAPQRTLASVNVDAYARDYEGQKTGSEVRYDSGIRSGLLARQSRAGDLEGNWLVSSLTGDKLVSLALRGGGTQVDGAWRSLQGGVGLNRSGLIDSASQTDDRLTLDYQSGSAKGRYRLDLRREPDGRWRGQMIDPEGAATPVVMQSQ